MNGRSLIRLLLVFAVVAKAVVVVLPTLTVGSAVWLLPIVVSLFYLGIGLFMLLVKDELARYHIDYSGVALFLLFSTVLRLDSAASNLVGLILKILVWVLSAVILFGIITGRVRLAMPSWHQISCLAPAVIGGILLALADGYVIAHKSGFHVEPAHFPLYLSADYIARSLAYQASNAAIPEEFLFRGLLWGYMISESYSEGRAALVQGVLFWLWHFDQALVSPVSFWLLLPAVTALLSWLTWRSRSLLPSIVAHSTYNALQIVMAVVLAARM